MFEYNNNIFIIYAIYDPREKLNLSSIYIKMDVYVYVYMFEHNSGTPGAISTKLGTHIAICMCKNLMYILYIFRREDGVGGRKFR
jgi:hypothetical protein